MFATLHSEPREYLVVLAVIVGTLAVPGCGASPPAMRSRTGPERTEITLAEVRPVARRVTNAYDVVRTVRPWMLVVRDRSRLLTAGPSTPNDTRGVRVYIDDISVGGVETLRTIPRDAIVFIQWFSAIDATTRYGDGHLAGVIAVTTGAHR